MHETSVPLAVLDERQRPIDVHAVQRQLHEMSESAVTLRILELDDVAATGASLREDSRVARPLKVRVLGPDHPVVRDIQQRDARLRFS